VCVRGVEGCEGVRKESERGITGEV